MSKDKAQHECEGELAYEENGEPKHLSLLLEGPVTITKETQDLKKEMKEDFSKFKHEFNEDVRREFSRFKEERNRKVAKSIAELQQSWQDITEAHGYQRWDSGM